MVYLYTHGRGGDKDPLPPSVAIQRDSGNIHRDSGNIHRDSGNVWPDSFAIDHLPGRDIFFYTLLLPFQHSWLANPKIVNMLTAISISVGVPWSHELTILRCVRNMIDAPQSTSRSNIFLDMNLQWLTCTLDCRT
jgi:hypothetical protein